jgi:hypothetical protein
MISEMRGDQRRRRHRGADSWTPHAAIRIDVVDEKIERMVDYIHCPWVIAAAADVRTA